MSQLSNIRLQPVNRILKWQSGMLILLTLVLWRWQGQAAAIAGIYGAAMAITNTLLIKWYLWRAAETARADAGKNLSKAYRCVAERWILTIAFFVIGFKVLALSPQPLLISFVLTQLMLFLGYKNRA